MEIRTLEGLPLSSIAETFNLAFSDYSIPLKLTTESFENKVKAENIDLRYSPGALIDGKLTGFILNGLDEVNGELKVFNAGTGVVPEHRGKRIIDSLYGYILPILAEQGYRQHQLEVIVGNDKAEKIYSRTGFKRVRKVTAFKSVVTSIPANSFSIEEVDSLDWAVAESFWNTQPTWQNNTQCLKRTLHNHRLLMATMEGEFAGYAAVDTTSGRLKQFAVKPAHRRKGIGRALFSMSANAKGEVSFTNFDESDAESMAAFKAMGFEPTVELYEMTLLY